MRGLPERRFTTHMVWYSQNSIPFVYKLDGISAHLPNFSYLWLDHIWVWTRGFAKYLESIGAHGELHAVGPVVWCLPEREPPARRAGTRRIAVFDVTPHKPASLRLLGLTYNYYREENAIRFIASLLTVRDRLEARSGERIEVVLKHKREAQPAHEEGYMNWIGELERSGRITLMPPQTNLYSMIGEADVVVVVPFSSPAHVGVQLGKPSVFFDATEEIVATHDTAGQVAFASGETQLQEWLGGALALTPQAPLERTYTAG
jgi:polysaccharide biosynthesis PFTS motif protein